MTSTQFDKEIDASGLKCPMPILKCKKGMSSLSSGQVLKITTTDRSAPKDFAAFCEQTGNQLLSEQTIEEKTIFHIVKR